MIADAARSKRDLAVAYSLASNAQPSS